MIISSTLHHQLTEGRGMSVTLFRQEAKMKYKQDQVDTSAEELSGKKQPKTREVEDGESKGMIDAPPGRSELLLPETVSSGPEDASKSHESPRLPSEATPDLPEPRIEIPGLRTPHKPIDSIGDVQDASTQTADIPTLGQIWRVENWVSSDESITETLFADGPARLIVIGTGE